MWKEWHNQHLKILVNKQVETILEMINFRSVPLQNIGFKYFIHFITRLLRKVNAGELIEKLNQFWRSMKTSNHVHRWSS